MVNELPLDATIIKDHLLNHPQDYIINGLLRGGVGFLISAPDMGKSHLCLTIAYELATKLPLLGIAGSKDSMRTLIWASEDSISATLPRVEAHLKSFTSKTKSLIAENVSLYTNTDPICDVLAKDSIGKLSSISKLIDTATAYDLLIIDTLRTAVGNADEVKDDALIRQSLDHIAKEANVAILVVHHPTKSVARGNDDVNSVSGSGLSSTLSKSKLHLYLNKTTSKSGKTETTLRHTKANYLTREKQFSPPQVMTWTENSLLCLHPDVLETDAVSITRKSRQQKALKNIPANKVIIDILEDDAPVAGGLAEQVFQKRNSSE